MAKKGRSEQGLFGTVYHYDEHGRKTGRSEPGFFGGYTNYDAKGNKVGRSEPGFFGGYTNYDAKGNKIGRSDPGLFGGYNHYDNQGHKTGSSDPGFFGSYSHNNTGSSSDSDSYGYFGSGGGSGTNQGCYIATCVYGSYDCPQVWTLRRYRDNTLALNAWGRAFIRTYYAVSPTVVKWFGKNKWFRKIWQCVLDRMVQRLNDRGVEDTPYDDRKW